MIFTSLYTELLLISISIEIGLEGVILEYL